MLQDEIENAQRLVKTDAYQMSIGELVNMYKEGELVINPDFQRLFRWETGQKSRLIESLLLGIPLPSIFVFEREDGTWELIDGLQRVSTILEFMGLLTDADTGEKKDPSVLTAVKYLSSLENSVWEQSERLTELGVVEQIELLPSHRLTIRRARIAVEILKRPSDSQTKYDLFQRLNSGGTPANSQELLNCILRMVDEEYFSMVKELADHPAFRTILSTSEEQIVKQRHMDYACRFLVLSHIEYDGKLDVNDFLQKGSIQLAEQGRSVDHANHFRNTFDLINNVLGENALKRKEDGSHVGRATLAAFECICIGVGHNLTAINEQDDRERFIRDKVDEFWLEDELDTFFTPGLRGTQRIQRTIPFGKQFFRP